MWMEKAVQSAREGLKKGHGGPFGACIVHKGELIVATHNTVLISKDPTRHAEMNAISQACQKLDTHILDDCLLYTTAEPCPMCLSAIYWARIPKVFVGVQRACAAKYGFDDAFFYEQIALAPAERSLEMEFGSCEQSCCKLFEDWKEEEGLLY